MAPPIQLDPEKFKEPGLYLLFDDGLFLTLTRDFIDQKRREYLADPALLPLAVRQAASYVPCSICPQRDTAKICHALPTAFPFLEDADRFLSYDSVLAVFRSDPCESSGHEGILHVARTSVQRALQHVSILSLMYYCEVGREYFKYFAGVLPFMHPMQIVERVYLNIFWDLKGDLAAVEALIAQMRKEMDITVACQIDRLRLFCRSDAFINAYVITHIVTQFLASDMEIQMRQLFNGRQAPVAQED